jgi:hypothetical protein
MVVRQILAGLAPFVRVVTGAKGMEQQQGRPIAKDLKGTLPVFPRIAAIPTPARGLQTRGAPGDESVGQGGKPDRSPTQEKAFDKALSAASFLLFLRSPGSHGIHENSTPIGGRRGIEWPP